MGQDNPEEWVAAVVGALEWASLQVAERLRNLSSSNAQAYGNAISYKALT